VWEQIRRARYLSLAQVFQMEYTMSLNCCRHPEFSEGVRARLLDKDNQPLALAGCGAGAGGGGRGILPRRGRAAPAGRSG
jgi:hypothetical protein